MQLTEKFVASAPKGVHSDGPGGLRLRVKHKANGTVTRVFECRVQENGKPRDKYIGATSKVTLAEARERAAGIQEHAAKVRTGVRDEAKRQARAETERQAAVAAEREAEEHEARARDTAIKLAAQAASQAAVERAAASVEATIFPAFREAYAGACMTALSSFNDPLAGYGWIVAANDAWPYMLGATVEDQRETIDALAVRIADTATRRDWIERVAEAGRACLVGPGAESHERATPGADDPSPVANGTPTFAEAAASAIPLTRRAPGQQSQMVSRLDRYAMRTIGKLPVDKIGRAEVTAVLMPLHKAGMRVARMLKQDVSAVLAWAVEAGHCEINFAAQSYTRTLPPLPAAQNHKAVSVKDAPAMFAAIGDERDADAALRFVILTAVRAAGGAKAEWSEIDLDERTWTIPAARMKAGAEHVVPLSDAAWKLLAARSLTSERYVFPDVAKLADVKKPLRQAMKRVDEAATVHGWRATFRIWAERRGVDFNLAEWCLAHSVGDATVRAYLRSETAIDRRREVMDEWAAYLAGEA